MFHKQKIHFNSIFSHFDCHLSHDIGYGIFHFWSHVGVQTVLNLGILDLGMCFQMRNTWLAEPVREDSSWTKWLKSTTSNDAWHRALSMDGRLLPLLDSLHKSMRPLWMLAPEVQRCSVDGFKPVSRMQLDQNQVRVQGFWLQLKAYILLLISTGQLSVRRAGPACPVFSAAPVLTTACLPYYGGGVTTGVGVWSTEPRRMLKRERDAGLATTGLAGLLTMSVPSMSYPLGQIPLGCKGRRFLLWQLWMSHWISWFS
jgi:hypothetical protein